jgi:glycosyltransferase involved in cell wall biosynthesis
LKHQKAESKTDGSAKTIYFVWNYLEWGGVQIYFLGLMRAVAGKYKIKAVLPSGSDNKILSYLKNNNIEYEFFEGKIDLSKAETVRRRIARRWNDFRTNLSLAAHFSKCDLRDSIIQIDVAPWSGFILLFYLTLRTNVFVTFHTALPQISFLKRFLWRMKFAVLTAFSRFHLAASNLDVKKSLRPFVNEARYRQLEVIYSSVNADEIEPVLNTNISRQEISLKYNFPADKIWVCNVAQFIERKGCWVFLEAIEILSRQRNDLFFVWLGTSPLSEDICERIEKYNLKEAFRFLSAAEIGANRNDLLTLLRANDLFVLPSFQEGLPVALIEAMALGKSCIASRVNAIPEAVKHCETGILIEAGDSLKLAAAISELADNLSLQKKLGAAAQKYVFENFEEKVTGRMMRRLYENV